MPDTAKASELLVALAATNNRIQQLEAELAHEKGRKEELETVLLPDAFAEAGVNEVTLWNGIKAKRGLRGVGSLPKEEPARTRALEWLIANDYEHVIAVEVTAQWTRGDRDKALVAYEHLRGDNTATVVKQETVHHSTLQAIAVARVREGKPVDLMRLGVGVVPRVRITTKGNSDDN